MTKLKSNNKNRDEYPLSCKIYAFRAKDNPELCDLFISGHQKVLADHGLEELIPTDDYWTKSNEVIVVLAINKGKPLGGIRLEPKVKERLLPFEKSLIPFEPSITELIPKLHYNSIYEACGLWNAKITAGNDLGILLCRVCVSIAPRLGIEAILSLNGVYTYKIPKDMGSEIIRSIGSNGLFKYPIERFHSALWIQNDLNKMKRASRECKTRVISLRDDPNQSYLEKNAKKGVNVKYHIEV